jgi:hypothetical protein
LVQAVAARCLFFAFHFAETTGHASRWRRQLPGNCRPPTSGQSGVEPLWAF